MQSTTSMRPWEKIGVPVTGRLTTGEALRITNNDWKVHKVTQQTAPRIVYLKDEETGEFALDELGCKIKDVGKSEHSDLFAITNPQMCMTVREDTRSYLGTVGVNYKVVQNDEAVAFFDEALGKNAACINAVGTLGRFGARMFIVAQVPEMLEVVPGDPIERHILLTTTHDGTGNIEARFITWRPASDSMVHTPGEVVKIRHTKNAKLHLKTAYQVLAKNEQFWDRAKRAYAYMAKRDVNDARCRAFLEAMFPDIIEYDDEGNEVERRTSPQALKARDEIKSLFKGEAPGAEKAGATDWGLYNSVAYFVDHQRRQGAKQREWKVSRWETSVFGPGANLRDRAYHWLRCNK